MQLFMAAFLIFFFACWLAASQTAMILAEIILAMKFIAAKALLQQVY